MTTWNVVLSISAEVEAPDEETAYEIALAQMVEDYSNGHIGDPRDMAHIVEEVAK